jgi:asparagine synthase (glutamine-hydrolysing)
MDEGTVDRRLVRRMARRLAHRGPDDAGFYFDRAIGICHRRLSLIDPAGGAQPMLDERGTRCLAANNEIYNYLELRERLLRAGDRFRTESDTEVMLRALVRYGPRALDTFDGMFALAFWDRERESLLLARDPFGVKPLYYFEAGGSLFFASELKALLASPAIPCELDLDAMDGYLRTLAVPDPLTVLKGVRKVPAGHYLVVRHGRVTVDRYWLPALHSPPAGRTPRLAGAATELADRLRQSVAISLRSDVPVGVLLSGGLDSSTVTALAVQSSSRRLHTFSAGFAEAEFDESGAGRAVAKHFGTTHHEVSVTKALATRLALRLAKSLDEPFADSSSIPTLAVCELASRHVKAVLSGEGSDELFGGYPWHRDLRAGRAEHPAHTVYRRAERQRVRRRHLAPPARRRPSTRMRGTTLLQRALARDLTGYLPSDILFKSDRVSMLESLEVRVPYLNRCVAEYAMTLPDAWKIRGREQKLILRRVARPLVPPSVLNKRKQGFSIPMDLWLWQPGEWRDMVNDTIFSRRTAERDQFDMRELERLRVQHDRLERLNGYKLWTVFMFEMWQREFLDGRA